MPKGRGGARGEGGGGGVFFRKQPRKTRGNRQNMNYTKNWGWKGGGEVVEGTQNCIKDITGTSSIMCVVCV